VHIATAAVASSQAAPPSTTKDANVQGKSAASAAAAAAETTGGSREVLPKRPARSDGTLPTPPANGFQFFGGEDEEFWDAVTMLATD